MAADHAEQVPVHAELGAVHGEFGVQGERVGGVDADQTGGEGQRPADAPDGQLPDDMDRLIRAKFDAAYRNAGGRAAVKGPQSFSMLFATDLNFVYVQAECAIDPSVTAAQREFASSRVVASLGSLPHPATVFQLAAAVEAA